MGLEYSVEPRIYMEETSVSDAALTMERYHRMVNYTSVAGSRAVTLPPVKEMVGQVVTVLITGYTSDEVTISPHADDEVDENIIEFEPDAASSHSSSFVLNAADEHVSLLSIGKYWIVLGSKVA